MEATSLDDSGGSGGLNIFSSKEKGVEIPNERANTGRGEEKLGESPPKRNSCRG